jgi:hypothetical protein
MWRLMVARGATALVAACAVAVLAAPAQAAKPCWTRVYDDWTDGRIDGTYSIACYRAALSHLPTDVREYTNAPDDIRRALLDTIQAPKRSARPGVPKSSVARPTPAADAARAARARRVQATTGGHASASSAPPLLRSGVGSNAVERDGPRLGLPLPLLVLAGVGGALLVLAAARLIAAVRRHHHPLSS